MIGAVVDVFQMIAIIALYIIAWAELIKRNGGK